MKLVMSCIPKRRLKLNLNEDFQKLVKIILFQILNQQKYAEKYSKSFLKFF